MSGQDTRAETPPPRSPQRRPRRAALIALAWVVGVLAVVVTLVLAAALILNSAAGHRFLAARLAKLKFDGLSVQVGRIDGSIWGRMVLRDVTLRDDQGIAAASPAITIDWEPSALIHRQVLIEDASSSLVRLIRKPHLKPSKTKSKAPKLAYTIHRLEVADLALGPALTGVRRDVALLASGDFRRGRVRLEATARAKASPQGPSGDVAAISLDAEPKANRLQISVHVHGPKGGVIDRLMKLGAPIELDLAGRGDWSDWRGAASASVGGAPILGAALTARSGSFAAAGSAQPGRIFHSLSALTSPVLRFDLAASVQGSQVGVSGWLATGAFQATASGAVDRKRRLLENVKVQASLVDLSALSPKLKGQDARISLFADGPYARPLIDYDLSASSLGYGAIVAETVQAHGRSVRVSNGTVQIPVSLTAARVAGFSKTAGPLTHVALSGEVTISSGGALRARLQLRSDHLSALVSLQGSQRKRTYSGSLSGRADAQAVSRLGLNSVLGGAVSFSTDFASSPAAPAKLFHLQATSPKLRVTGGEGSYSAGGAISGRASVAYSKIGAAQVMLGGTVHAPRAHISAARLKRPIPLTDLEVDLASAPGGWRLSGSARTAYGPAALDALIETGKGGLSIAVRRAGVAGITLAGTLTRTAEGPFAGLLTVGGDGLSGTIRVEAAGSAQAAKLALRARNARLPLSPPIEVSSGEVEAAVTLRPGAPSISGSARLVGVRRGGLSLASLKARFTSRSGTGTASVALAGESGAPFRFAGDADFGGGRIRLTGQGEIAHVGLRLAAPMEVTHQSGAWRLAPVTILTSGGRMILAGSYDGGLALSAKLQSLDLRLIRVIRPGLTLGGRLSGEIELRQAKGAAPSGTAELQIVGLSQTGETTISAPTDVNLLGRLTGTGGDLSADFRHDGAAIGRLQARLSWPQAGSFSARLRAARIQGGVRYNGPAQILVGLIGMAGQEVSGPLAIGADVTGTLQSPSLTGVAHARGLEYQNARFGTRITGIDLDGVFRGTRFTLQNLTGNTSGGGRISASGFVDLSAAAGWPMRLTAKLEGVQIAQSDQLGARLSGTLTISNSRKGGGLVSGELTVERASYQISRGGGAAETAELRGVHWKGQPLAAPKSTGASGPPSHWRLNIEIHAPNRIVVNGLGLDAEWRADLHVSGETNAPKIVGDVRSIRGTFSFAGRRMTLEDSVIHFDGSNPPDPTLVIVADDTVNGVTATITVSGTAHRPQITFSSTPAMPEDEVLSNLLFGGSAAQLSSLQALQLAASLNALRGGAGGLGLLGKLSRAAGVQNLRFQAPNAQTGQGYSVGAGKYISNKIYVDILTDARGFTSTQIQVALTKALSLLSQISTFGTTSGSIRYTHRY